jgi:hypothetical protein
MSETKEIREINEAELPSALKDHWKNAKASVEKNNHGYAIKFLQAILKEEPGFLNARKLVRQAEIIETGAIPGAAKKGLFGTSGGGRLLYTTGQERFCGSANRNREGT